MNRFLLLLIPVVCVIIMLPGIAVPGYDTGPSPCLECHQDVYIKSISYRYQHSVVKDQCSLCHIKSEGEKTLLKKIVSHSPQREWLIYLDQLSEDQGYEAEVILKDGTGQRSDPSVLFIFQKNLLEPAGGWSSPRLMSLSGVTVDEIKKGAFVSVLISWDTDVFASSEIEYRLPDGRERIVKAELFTTSHTMELTGLQQDSRYVFRAVSRDVQGNTMKSQEYSFDTAEEFSRAVGTGEDDSLQPAITRLEISRAMEGNGVYLNVWANKPSELSVNISNMGDKHGYGFFPSRYSTIEVCYKCHRHDASHPVGIKAVSSKIRTPDGVPTIEDGVITCVTCHEPHGGGRMYYSRFDFRKNLCMRCHLQKYSM